MRGESPAKFPAQDGVFHIHRLQHQGRPRRYLAFCPNSYDGRHPWPLLLVLHGAGATSMWTMRETRWDETATREGFLVAFPEGTPADPTRPQDFLRNPLVWNDGSFRGAGRHPEVDDVGYLRAVLERLVGHYNVCQQAVYVTGFSNGAGMAFRFAAESAPRLAGIAPVAGHCWVKDPRPACPLPTFYAVGTEDPLVPLKGGEVHTPWGWSDVRPPVLETLQTWGQAIGAPPEPHVVHADGSEEASTTGGKFPVYILEGHGHHWPGGRGQIDPEMAVDPEIAGPNTTRFRINDAIWQFFREHRPPAPWRER
jgi:polyhydroxybutyrate depolymerase